MRWTAEQELILRTHGSRGAKFCRDLIHKRFGIYRTVEATQRHASRIGALMVVYEICPECGRAERRLNRMTGMCEACNYDRLWREQAEEAARILADMRKGGSSDEVARAKRRYDAQRQKVSRLRRKEGCGDRVDMSSEMSRRRSEAKKDDGKEEAEAEKSARAWKAGGANEAGRFYHVDGRDAGRDVRPDGHLGLFSRLGDRRWRRF